MRHRGFSMIELIVVMGIVALLSALLFPILAATKSKAGETACMSNLRQLGIAMLMYKDEEGEFPWNGHGAFERYLGHARLYCPKKPGNSAYNFSTYSNNAIFTAPAKDPFSKKVLGALQDCYEARGPQFPLLADQNHLPKVLVANDARYWLLVFRVSGAVQRVPSSKSVQISIASANSPFRPSPDLPCLPAAGNGNL